MNTDLFQLEEKISTKKTTPNKSPNCINYFKKAKASEKNPFLDMQNADIKKVIIKLDSITEMLEKDQSTMVTLYDYSIPKFGVNKFTGSTNNGLQYYFGMLRKAHRVVENPEKNNFSLHQIKNLNLLLRKLNITELKFNCLGDI